MPLSWNEIKDRAIAFSKEFEKDSSEDAEAKSFWDAFFHVFGITRRRVATFEQPVKKDDGKGGFIDLLWKGNLVVEHKSRGKNLNRAFVQAKQYFSGLKERDLPRYVLVSDFARFRLYDLDKAEEHEFALKDLHKNVRLFGFIAGYESKTFTDQDPVNIKAAEKLGLLHDQLKASGYEGHPLEVLLVRLLFCLFAEDNSIFERQQFRELIEQRTAEDGSDLGPMLANLFQTLNTPAEKRLKKLDEQLAAFPYINGRLFAEPLPLAAFDAKMRDAMLNCCALDWSLISPAIFGALFQSIMDKKARRDLGAHYTSEQNILKALGPLFLDDLNAEFEKVKRDRKRLVAFQQKLARIKILDPACGCGNFLVIAYRELRKIELDVLREVYKSASSGMLDVSSIVFVDVDQFYGIELEEFPAQIAQVSLWMADHQMNLKVSEAFGQYFARLPLKKAPNILHDNALTVDWSTVVAPTELTYIVGNPPFLGHHLQSAEQKQQMLTTFGEDGPSAGVMDFVSAWYCKAAAFIQDTPIKVAFVSTNSITQGEQVGILWRSLMRRFPVYIHFAHKTFKWSSEARGKAAVYCVIIGFAATDNDNKVLYEYDSPDGDPHAVAARRINAYLVDGPWVLLENRSKNMFGMPEMMYGSKPTDDGNYLFTDQEKKDFLAAEPGAKKFMKPFVSAHEFLHGEKRWVLWLVSATPADLALPMVKARVKAVDAFRKASKAPTTRKYPYPMLFRQVTQPTSDYIVIPAHSSETREFIPLGFMSKDQIVGNSCFALPGATLFHFGVMMSRMHMAWVKYTCGRLESRYRYSKDIVYNNFPWPTANEKQITAIETAAQTVLDARAKYQSLPLADLYDPVAMPVELVKAHALLDKAVEKAYGVSGLGSDNDRVALLFERYLAAASVLDEGVSEKKSRRSRAEKV
ncbi:class I SAM-dependent DNA methyltransferase [Herbaspirillum huttiense]|uniref:class I SAM-dependent DNA methyltransferase n=1 Tax=Herbaspirillum huttiense TaxID=863372 RepID=UPI0039B06472